MAKIQIKSEKITPFGGIFPIMDVLSGIVDSTLGFRFKLFGYQYSEIIRSLMCVYFCGKTYEFNKAEKLNTLLLEALLTTGQLTKGFCLTL